MSTHKLAGVYITETARGIAPTPSTSTGAVAIIGHMQSGSSGYDIADSEKWSASNEGEVFVWNNLIEAVQKCGLAVSGSWDAGTYSKVDFGTGAYDNETNLIRAVELAFVGGATKVYACVLSGTGTYGTSADTGTTQALAQLREFDDVYYVVVAGKPPIAAVTSEMETASSADNGKERIYITGVGYQEAFSGTTYDLSSYAGAKSDYGRTICLIGNTVYKFGNVVYDVSDTHLAALGLASGSVEISGNWLASWLAGKRASMQPHVPLKTLGYTPVWNGTTTGAVLKKADMESMSDDHVLFGRRWSTGASVTYMFDKGWTFSPFTSDFQYLTTREIADTAAKRARNTLLPFLFAQNTAIGRSTARSRVESTLRDMVSAGMIKEFAVNVYATPTDEANHIMRCDITVVPVFEITEINVNLVISSTV